ncbi:MAG: hypothetical protein ABL901_18130 [Hyphomicrobiaceae bacterium]
MTALWNIGIIFADWFKYFKGIDFIVPLAAAVIASLFLKHQITKSTEQMKRDLNEAVGGFRVEVRKLTQGAGDALKASAKSA